MGHCFTQAVPNPYLRGVLEAYHDAIETIEKIRKEREGKMSEKEAMYYAGILDSKTREMAEFTLKSQRYTEQMISMQNSMNNKVIDSKNTSDDGFKTFGISLAIGLTFGSAIRIIRDVWMNRNH